MRWVALPALVAVWLATSAPGGGSVGSAACPPNLANRIASDGQAAQLVTVVAPRRSSTQGTLRLWRRTGRCWRAAAGPWTAWLGQQGVSATKHEGDRTTPAGRFGFARVMYGISGSPGVHYPYHRIVCGDWWVEDPRSPYYNRFRHVRCGSKPPFRVTSEDMSRSPTAYRHLVVIDYNTHPVVRGRGSGIFLHRSTGRATLGCISLPLPQLVTVLRWLDPAASPSIVIGTSATIRDY
jgi:L,D-peptidoglycan transpeptidase YkuD (ErfK/YbiS/YcfS/YnhG family)